MHFANRFAYLISYHLLRTTLPSESVQHACDNVWTDCPYVPTGFETAPYQSREVQLWHAGLKTWDAETVVAHCAYRKYIGSANRLFCLFRSRKLGNVHHLDDIDRNVWYSPRIRDIMRALYYKTHRIRAALLRFVRIWRFKRSAIQVSTDLYMAPLDPACKRTFKLLQDGRIYLFSLQDLTNLIVSAITHHNVIGYSRLEHYPKTIKNPYTNIPLEKSDLCNIYFRMRDVHADAPEMIRRFFRCEFNIYRFAKENRRELEIVGVRAICKNMSKPALHDTAIMLLSRYATHAPRGATVRFNYPQIHPDFPKDALVHKLRPYLELCFLAQYTSDGQYEYEPLLKRRMGELFKQNPYFGQPIYGARDGYSGVKSIVGFYDWTPPIRPSFMHYLDTHKYVDATNNRFSFMGDSDETYYIESNNYFAHVAPVAHVTQIAMELRDLRAARELMEAMQEMEDQDEIDEQADHDEIADDDDSTVDDGYSREFDDTFDD